VRRARPKVPSLREAFECCPIAYTAFKCAVVLVAGFNFGTYVIATASPSLYADWLAGSQPFTDWTASFFSIAVNAAAGHLQQQHAAYLIPAIRNILAINFSLAIVLLVCFAVGLSVDVMRRPREVRSGVLILSTKMEVTFLNVAVRCAVLFVPISALIYLGGFKYMWRLAYLPA
jgi:hypothetical protein